MKLDLRTSTLAATVAVFIGLPLLLYALGDFPRRSVLKEVLSVITLLAFMLVLGQFFLARSNAAILSLFKPQQIQRVHKYIAYSAISVLLLHPFLIVLPRYFEAGVKPLDALITMLTSLDSLGVVLGMIAWALMLVLGASAMFRMTLIKRFAIRYRNWRYFHGTLSVGFAGLTLWHSIELGRHTDLSMSLVMAALALVGAVPLLRLYRDAIAPARSQETATPEGAK